MNYEVVSGIPSGILACKIGENEVAIRRISPEHIEIQVTEKIVKEVDELEFYYYSLAEASYRRLEVRIAHCITVEEGDLFYSYSYAINDVGYREMFEFVVKQYYQYIMLKSEAYDNQFSKELVGYPAEKDELFSVDYGAWCNTESIIRKIEELDFEVAISLENEIGYRGYLAGEVGTQLGIQRIYIGNTYCPQLFPGWTLLKKILHQAKKNKHQITIVTSYLKENSTGYKMKENLQKICEWCRINRFKVEIEVNDWGYLQEIYRNKWIDLTLGRLLNKRRKDPRYPYKSGFAEQNERLAENQLNQPLFTKFLNGKGIWRYEYETCGYRMKIAEGTHSLHLPVYQTNTSQFCPLRALCEEGDRGVQKAADACSKYCEKYVCAYPKHLHMIGRYNSLFALDTKLMEHLEWLDEYKKQGIDRIVWNMK